MTPFHSTGKADFCLLKIPCVLKIFSKTRRVKNSPATGVTCPFPGRLTLSPLPDEFKLVSVPVPRLLTTPRGV